ncbi:hypothetical protein EXN51_15420 [Agrobacterium fabrum]|uniref:Uncharacterized protein n=1 Tax=Agrobacterium fabrum (strain C58 / ATCC 33970) TaxID=176299 RepID=Q7D3L8_AGRFC|nr:conserved hypothetical protein [Agrobacterium fabrum str. C58]TRB28334.1 hypothetical protein EXN51_15420 [Agrobacterium fabrum]
MVLAVLHAPGGVAGFCLSTDIGGQAGASHRRTAGGSCPSAKLSSENCYVLHDCRVMQWGTQTRQPYTGPPGFRKIRLALFPVSRVYRTSRRAPSRNEKTDRPSAASLRFSHRQGGNVA